jgi:outer membrane receptor protein involved in Fe transport
MGKFSRNPLTKSISMALMGTVAAAAVVAPVQAQDEDDVLLEEVIVTATKRERSLQDVAISIQVLGNEQLENLGVRGFADYIHFLPTVALASGSAGAAPGWGQIYMRGIASGGDGNHSASMPSVGYYLDEQPMTTISQILDVHMYDIARVEVLAGPQGTLYGQGSQSGTIRIITNKPEMGISTGGFDVEANTTKSGDPGYDLSGFWNFPLGERAAVRLVGWHKKLGGYIDVVPTTMTFPGPRTHVIDSVAEEDQNEAKTTGLRALLRVDLNDNWSITPGIIVQNSDQDGYWESNPELFGELETGRFWEAGGIDDWYQASLTLNGSIGDVDLVYAGAYLDREQDYEYDYSDYTEYWAFQGADYEPEDQWCVYYSERWDENTDYYECAIGTQYVGARNRFKRNSHELRIQSSTDQRFRWIGGLFYQKQEHNFDLQWIVPDLDPVRTVVLPSDDPSRYGGTTVWQTYQIREDRDQAVFGELYFDFTEKLTGTLGARYFEFDNTLYGFNGFARHCTGVYIDGVFEERTEEDGGEMQYPCFETRILDNVAEGDDWAFKVNLEYRITDQKMIYATWSEGFRAGGANRARVEGLEGYDPDFVTNYEFGWKMVLGNGRVRFNGAVYLIDWDNFQFGFLDFTLSNLTIVQNVGDSRTKGVEWDLTWGINDRNYLTFSGSYNNAKLTTDFWRNPADTGNPDIPYNAPKGTRMPYIPRLQLTGIWRSNFELGSMPGFFQAAASYTAKRWNDLDTLNVIARREMDDYTLVNLSTGIDRENWTLTFYINNLLDERAELDIKDPGYGDEVPGYGHPPGHNWTTSYSRPRTMGIRWAQRF